MWVGKIIANPPARNNKESPLEVPQNFFRWRDIAGAWAVLIQIQKPQNLNTSKPQNLNTSTPQQKFHFYAIADGASDILKRGRRWRGFVPEDAKRSDEASLFAFFGVNTG